MEPIFERIWKRAKQYYLKARSTDIFHIEWMIEHAEKIAEKIGADKEILMPLIILHDSGYYGLDMNNIAIKEAKEIHMREGAKIAEKILKEINYNPELTEKIVYFVSVHDNWFYNEVDIFKNSRELSLFNDLDFISSIVDEKRVDFIKNKLKLDNNNLLEFFSQNEKLVHRPLYCKETKELFEQAIENLRKL